MIPKEGATEWVDTMAIPADAPHAANAHAFLNFLMEPAVMAAISNEIGCANANLASVPHLKPELKDDPSIYPPRRSSQESSTSPTRSSQDYSREAEPRLDPHQDRPVALRMEHRWLPIAASLSLLAACGGAGDAPSSPAAEEKVVHVYNWVDYVGPTTIADFEARTGIRVVYDTYDANEILETKMLTGRSGYDVVFPSAVPLARQVGAGAIGRLDKSKLPNLVHMDPVVMERIALNDPGNAHAIPYMWGTAGIGYNPDKVEKVLGTDTIDSWSAIFDPAIAVEAREVRHRDDGRARGHVHGRAHLPRPRREQREARGPRRRGGAPEARAALHPVLQYVAAHERPRERRGLRRLQLERIPDPGARPRRRRGEPGEARLCDPEGGHVHLVRHGRRSRPTRRIPATHTPSSTT